MTIRKYIALMRAGIMESLHFRLGTAVTLFANLIYLVLVYFLWKAVYASSGVDVVNGMTFNDTMIYLILATALFNHKLITAEFRAGNQGLGASKCSGAIAWV